MIKKYMCYAFNGSKQPAPNVSTGLFILCFNLSIKSALYFGLIVPIAPRDVL